MCATSAADAASAAQERDARAAPAPGGRPPALSRCEHLCGDPAAGRRCKSATEGAHTRTCSAHAPEALAEIRTRSYAQAEATAPAEPRRRHRRLETACARPTHAPPAADVCALFPRRAAAFAETGARWPLHVDLGCAKGGLVLALAAARADTCFLGVEFRSELVEAANELVRERGLANAAFVVGDVAAEGSDDAVASGFGAPTDEPSSPLCRLLASARRGGADVVGVSVLFPSPLNPRRRENPKTSNRDGSSNGGTGDARYMRRVADGSGANRRLKTQRLLTVAGARAVSAHLTCGGELHVASDYEGIATSLCAAVRQGDRSGAGEPCPSRLRERNAVWEASPTLGLPTERDRVCQVEWRPVWRKVWVATGPPQELSPTSGDNAGDRLVATSHESAEIQGSLGGDGPAGDATGSGVGAGATVLVREGGCELRVSARLASSPGGTAGFFNPRMRANREFALAALAAATALRLRESGQPTAHALDACAASGALGLRWATQGQSAAAAAARAVRPLDTRPLPEIRVHLNDLDEQCVRLCEVNVTANGLSTRVEAVHARDCRALLCERVFDFVHLDPFGSVAPQLDAAFGSAPHGSVVSLTATDTAAIYGIYPRCEHLRTACARPRRSGRVRSGSAWQRGL